MHKSKLNVLLISVLSLLLWNCRGDQGPIGPQGDRGPIGPAGPVGAPAPLALKYEIVFDLNPENEWRIVYPFPEDDEIFPDDVVLVYLLWKQETAQDGSLIDVWRLMPITYFQQRGVLNMVSDFTGGDVSIYLEASYPLDAQVVMNEIAARIVILPAEQSPNQRKGFDVDYQDYNEVKKVFGLKETGTVKGKPFMQLMKESDISKKKP